MNIYEPTPEQRQAWRDLVEAMPPAPRAIGRKLWPWKLYRMKTSGVRCVLTGIDIRGYISVNMLEVMLAEDGSPFNHQVKGACTAGIELYSCTLDPDEIEETPD